MDKQQVIATLDACIDDGNAPGWYLEAMEQARALLAAPLANPSDKQEAVKCDTCAAVGTVASINARCTLCGMRNAAPLAQSAEPDRIDAERRAEYWKAEHLAGNKEIERLKAALESRVSEQDRIDAERYRRAREADYIVNSTERAIDNWIKGASK